MRHWFRVALANSHRVLLTETRIRSSRSIQSKTRYKNLELIKQLSIPPPSIYLYIIFDYCLIQTSQNELAHRISLEFSNDVILMLHQIFKISNKILYVLQMKYIYIYSYTYISHQSKVICQELSRNKLYCTSAFISMKQY